MRDFAQGLIAEHAAANAELTRLVTGKRLPLPLAASGSARAQADELAAMASASLDPAYLRRMIEEQDRAAALYRRRHDGGSGDELADFAASRLPVIERHLRLARVLMKGKSSGKRHKSHRKGS